MRKRSFYLHDNATELCNPVKGTVIDHPSYSPVLTIYLSIWRIFEEQNIPKGLC